MHTVLDKNFVPHTNGKLQLIQLIEHSKLICKMLEYFEYMHSILTGDYSSCSGCLIILLSVFWHINQKMSYVRLRRNAKLRMNTDELVQFVERHIHVKQQ